MNILYINRGMELGGVEKCIVQLAKMFKNENHKIVVASMGGELVNELDKIEVKHEKILNTDSKNPIKILRNLIKIYRIIKNENIEIIHSHHRMTTLLCKIVSKFTNIKIIHTQHLCIEDKFRLTNLALRNIRVITVSEAAKRILIEKAKLKEKYITTIYNTIETECENKIVDERLINLKNKGFFIVGQVSRMVNYKGVYDFIEVAKKTSLENEKIKFVLMGEGPELDNIKRIIKEENLDEIIYLLGAKDNIIEHLKYVDVLLLCSYIEGLPLAPIEAFSQGIPVIATNIDGSNEEIEDGINGFLVDTKDIYSFNKYILRLYNDSDLFLKLKVNCLNSFKKNFNKERYIKKHNELYR